VALGAPFLDQLLGGDIASSKQDCSRHALGEIRTGCEPSIVPTKKSSHDEGEKNTIYASRKNASTNLQGKLKKELSCLGLESMKDAGQSL
jgi:hypothetical protein